MADKKRNVPLKFRRVDFESLKEKKNNIPPAPLSVPSSVISPSVHQTPPSQQSYTTPSSINSYRSTIPPAKTSYTTPPAKNSYPSTTPPAKNSYRNTTPPLSDQDDPLYSTHYGKWGLKSYHECITSNIAMKYKCSVVRQRSQSYAAVLGGDRNLVVGMFTTPLEAIRRAVAAANVIYDIDSNYLEEETNSNHSMKPVGISIHYYSNTNNIDLNLDIDHIMASNPNQFDDDFDDLDEDDMSSSSTMNRKHRNVQPSFLQNKHFIKPRACQIIDNASGKVVQEFKSVGEAERITRINKNWISKVCRQGGGVLEGKYFQFPQTSQSQNVQSQNDCMPLPSLDSPLERQFQYRSPSKKMTDNVCIICQMHSPQVVFQPCSHMVLCQKCAKEHCSSFCPVCRCPIQKRKISLKHPTFIRPRIFSYYAL